MLGIIADHAAPEQEVMTQRRVAKESPGTPAREAFARQAQRISDRRAEDRPGELLSWGVNCLPPYCVGHNSLLENQGGHPAQASGGRS
jgi:hypothetical protein